MYRCAIITNKGTVKSINLETRDKVEEWLLSEMDNEGVKSYRIIDKTTGEWIETDRKVYKKKGDKK